MRNNFKAATATPAASCRNTVDRRKPLNICIHEKSSIIYQCDIMMNRADLRAELQ